MKQLAAAVLILGAVACATAPRDEPMTAPPTVAAPDPRIAELQTAMTEMLERVDVLNDRMARLEEDRARQASPAAPAVTEPAATQPAAAPPPQPQHALMGAKLAEDYRRAITLFGQGKHAEARRGFQAVFDADAVGDLADNALFWIGETYFAAGDFTNAVRFYNRVVNEFSDQNKAPDALYKIAIAQERTGDLALARKTLQQVIDRYPYSTPASTAKLELQRIRY
jgi:tol-pal system protein YbgF